MIYPVPILLREVSMTVGLRELDGEGSNGTFMLVYSGIGNLEGLLDGGKVGLLGKVHPLQMGEFFDPEGLEEAKDLRGIVGIIDMGFVDLVPVLHARAEVRTTISLAKLLEGRDK